jgi:glycosyltransferase involved in cell wall biosynthesis
VDRLLSVSERLADRMAEEFDVPRRTITTIPNGVDLQRFSAAERRRAPSTDAQARVTIGTIGRLVPVKDQSNLLRALAMLEAGPAGVRASIVGDGPLRNDLDRERRDLGLEEMVQLPGFRADVEHALASFDIFVLSSQSEGMSNTILEAMASGLPVVATRVGGADELVQDGVTGLLVPAHDPAALAKALDTLVSDPGKRRQFGSAGRRRALERFGLERMLNDYEHLYRDIVPARVTISTLTAAAS